MAETVQLVMAIVLFVAGIAMLVSGVVIILTREYQEAMRSLSSQSSRLSGKALTELGVQAAIDGTAQLLESLTRLVQTAMGTGAFLCLLGTILCAISFWMLTLVQGG